MDFGGRHLREHHLNPARISVPPLGTLLASLGRTRATAAVMPRVRVLGVASLSRSTRRKLIPCQALSVGKCHCAPLADGRIASNSSVVTRVQRERRRAAHAQDGVSHGDPFCRSSATNPLSTTKQPASWARLSTRRARAYATPDSPLVVHEVIAKRIIKAAMKGERDPARLRAAGLAALGYDREAI